MRWKTIGKQSGGCDIDMLEIVSALKSGTSVVQIDEEKLGNIVFLKKIYFSA